MGMQKFDDALKSTMDNEISVTENGAVGYKTSGKKLLDINFATSSLRNKSASEIEGMFSDAFYENPLLAVKWLFFLRDIRCNGMGERRSFRICFGWLANARPELVKKLIPLVAEYGRFDDLLNSGLEGDLWDAVVDFIDAQWTNDFNAMKEGKPISLLAKWLPSVNTSSPKTVALAKRLAAALKLSEKQYRKTLSKMRAYLKVIEVNMSAKKWSEIDYEAVPSKANCKYNRAFLRNDETRRRAYLGALEKGEAKINSSTNFPSDIVHAYTSNSGWRSTLKSIDPALEGMWKALPDYTKGLDTGSTIVTADGSASMTSTVGSSSVTCLDVANSLAVYFAEKLTGVFKDKYITFSDRPQYVDFSKAKSLREKLAIALKHNECASTDIEAVFELLLKTARDNNLEQKDIPANVLIVSDMEFNGAVSMPSIYGCYGYDDKYNAKKVALFENIKKEWESYGYKLPRLVFWNVCSRTGTIPLQQNDCGVALVSGFSPAIAKMVFSAKLDPFEVLVDQLNDKRYDAVEAAVKDLV